MNRVLLAVVISVCSVVIVGSAHAGEMSVLNEPRLHKIDLTRVAQSTEVPRPHVVIDDCKPKKEIYYDGVPVKIKTAYRIPTEVVFDTDISSVVIGTSENSVSLESAPNILFIQPLIEDLSADIFVIGVDGKSRILKVVPASPEKRDRMVCLTMKDKQQKEAIR